MTSALDRLQQEAQEMRSFSGGGGRGVQDITEAFTTASELLQPGELIKDEFFTLFESVGALEIMDPKMDSGYIPPGDTFEPDFDPASTILSLREILWVMDQLACLEIVWYEGYPLSQTVFTSLHIDALLDPSMERALRTPASVYASTIIPKGLSNDEQLRHEVLAAYCVGIIKTCAVATELVQSQNFYEEEDFVTHCFGREFLPRLTVSNVVEMLQGAVTKLVDIREIQEDVRQAFKDRLTLRILFLRVLTEGGGGEEWKLMTELIEKIRQSHDDTTAPIPDAFSEKVQRKLATSTPPRPMLTISWLDACKKWTTMCEDAVAVHRLTEIEIVQSPACLHRAIWAFSYRRAQQPFALPRAIFQDILFAGQAIRDQIPHYDLLLADIRDLVLAGHPLVDPLSFQIEVPTDSRHICSRLIEGFMEKAIEEYLNLYRMVCQNRCRIRRTFTQAIPILDALESEAANVDHDVRQLTPGLEMKDPTTGKTIVLDPLTGWTKFHKLRVMAWTIQLGFETEIYLPDELAGMYWFLSRLCMQRSELLGHFLRFTIDRRKKLSRRDQNAIADCLLSEEYLKSLQSLSDITKLIAEALWRLYAFLTASGIITTPKRDYAQQQLLYDARMKPYLCIVNDPIPSPEDFGIAATWRAAPLELVRADVDERIKTARALLASVKKLTPEQGKFVGTEEEFRKEIKGMEATCVAIAVAASQLRSAEEKFGVDGFGQGVEWKVEKRYAEWWVVPVLKVKEKGKEK